MGWVILKGRGGGLLDTVIDQTISNIKNAKMF